MVDLFDNIVKRLQFLYVFHLNLPQLGLGSERAKLQNLKRENLGAKPEHVGKKPDIGKLHIYRVFVADPGGNMLLPTDKHIVRASDIKPVRKLGAGYFIYPAAAN